MRPSDFANSRGVKQVEVKLHGGMASIKCDFCPFTATKTAYMSKHLRSFHSDSKLWECTFLGCDLETKYQRTLRNHSKLHESNIELRKPYACTFQGCNHRSTKVSNLKSHVNRRHTPNKTVEFSSNLCSPKFYT